MWIDRFIVGLMFAGIILNTVGIFSIWRKMVDQDTEFWTTLEDDDDDFNDDDDDEDIFPPYSPKNRVRYN